VRPRYGRIAALGSSVAVTAVAMLGGIGVLPSVASSGRAPAAHDTASVGAADSDIGSGEAAQLATATYAASAGPTPSAPLSSAPADQQVETDVALPPDSGEGRRVVFSQALQRVWLVKDDESVKRSYLVSGSTYDNLDPGTYSVYSRSQQAWGIDDSGSMRYFVRFTQGDNGGAIGFHDIPVSNGQPVQTEAQLGTAQSHGCIRQATEDAVALWHFAPVGTEVVVTA
jgi:hypothetical protein